MSPWSRIEYFLRDARGSWLMVHTACHRLPASSDGLTPYFLGAGISDTFVPAAGIRNPYLILISVHSSAMKTSPSMMP